MIRIGICDDSPAFLQQTKHILDGWVHRPQDITTDFFEDGDALLTAHAQKPFDIILLDIVMPLLNGIEAAREIRETDVRKLDLIDYAEDILILHGTKDEIIDYAAVQSFSEDQLIDLIPFEGADHRFRNPQTMDLAIKQILEFYRL